MLREDQAEPETLRPLIAIGHTKDPIDLHTVDHFLVGLAEHSIPVLTFVSLLSTLACPVRTTVPIAL